MRSRPARGRARHRPRSVLYLAPNSELCGLSSCKSLVAQAGLRDTSQSLGGTPNTCRTAEQRARQRRAARDAGRWPGGCHTVVAASFRARQILITNGQQTLGVALPWGIAASIVRPADKILSISGDGGFLFSAMELETAVRPKANIVHMVWIDGAYDMVATQEMLKYGRASGIAFGPVDLVKYAEAFGATGLMIRTPDEIAPTLKRALNLAGPVIVGVHVDYRDNHKLFEMVNEEGIH